MAAVLNKERNAADSDLTVSWLDRLGIGVSAFCLLQCLALPVLLVVAPTLSAGFLSHEVFHVVLLAVILPVSGLAYTLGYLKHRNPRIWIPAAFGLGFLVLALLLELEHALPPLGIAAVTSVGGVLLIIGHLLNLKSRGTGVG
jgi:hypothetical protein